MDKVTFDVELITIAGEELGSDSRDGGDGRDGIRPQSCNRCNGEETFGEHDVRRRVYIQQSIEMCTRESSGVSRGEDGIEVITSSE